MTSMTTKDLVAEATRHIETISADEAVKRVINIPSKTFGKPTHFLGQAFLAEVETQAGRKGHSLYRALALGQFKTTNQGLAVPLCI